jgi:hypothetical protein
MVRVDGIRLTLKNEKREPADASSYAFVDMGAGIITGTRLNPRIAKIFASMLALFPSRS